MCNYNVTGYVHWPLKTTDDKVDFCLEQEHSSAAWRPEELPTLGHWAFAPPLGRYEPARYIESNPCAPLRRGRPHVIFNPVTRGIPPASPRGACSAR
jgi:hypothetical protein